jgi:putative MATE family efflux protein
MSAAAIAAAQPAVSPRTRALLEAPILPTLLRLAWPNVLVMLAQSSTGLIETWWVAKLGTDALAGMALVFPGVMLMQMMSAGAMGGGISSAIARALGARRQDDANALVVHAILICVALGAAFSFLLLTFGASLYRVLGGEGGSLRAALTYSNVIFSGAIILWVFNGLASVLRGTGNMLVPALVIVGGTVVLVPLSPCLIFGIGPFPALGVAGGGLAMLMYYTVGTAILAAYLWTGKRVLKPRLRGVRIHWALFADILRVGALAAIVTIQTNITIGFTTFLVGRFGPAAIAGYGTGARLEYLLIPLVFGFGAPLVALVGTNIGAGQRARAMRVAWIGAFLSAAMTEAIGLAAAIWPTAWLGLFGDDPGMLAAGATYLRIVGPFYGLFGFGMALYFASQGAGRLLWPLLAGLLRMLVGVLGGLAVLTLTGSLAAMFLVQGLALSLIGIVNGGAVASGVWFRGR